MRPLFRYGLVVAACVIVGVFLYAFIMYLPGRSVELATSVVADGAGTFTTLLKNIFAPRDVSLVVFGKPGGSHQGADLADAIIVVHYSPDRNALTLISIPRDLWIADDRRQFKINEVFRLSTPSAVINTIERITGLSIRGYVTVDLSVVERFIDDLGGVDVTLRAPAVDWVSGYTMLPGLRHLSGEDAVWLMRNRFSSEGDFFREKNQHAIVHDVLLKFRALDRDAQLELMNTYIFNTSLLSDAHIDADTIFSYLLNAHLETLSVRSVVLDFSTKLLVNSSVLLPGVGTTTRVSVLLPTQGFERYDAIRAYIQQMLK